MSFLTPLYLAGLAAVSLPVLFHLIRRAPRGRVAFSSLMFLSPSPPRVSRRSRVDHWLLLLLRAGAICLLALAFSRPLWRQFAEENHAAGRRVAILVDTSASMRRQDLWQKAINAAAEAARRLEAGDRLSLFTFDRQLAPRLDDSKFDSAPFSQWPQLIQDRLARLSPTWNETDLGGALSAAAESLVEEANHSADAALQLVVVSDLQQGSRLESLDAIAWPADVRVSLEKISPQATGNAAARLLPEAENTSDSNVRVRVVNSPTGRRQQFVLRWTNAEGSVSGEPPCSVYVPPGESRIVAMKPPVNANVDRLLLEGDGHDFDNAHFFIPPRQQRRVIVYVGDDQADDPRGLLYYLRRAFPRNPRMKVEVLAPDPGGPRFELQELLPHLAIVAADLPPDAGDKVRRFLVSGGVVLFVMRKDEDQQTIAALTGKNGIETAESAEVEPTSKYAMLSDVSFAHPIFAPLAEARFADFTKVRFWNHRRLRVHGNERTRVLARFDNGDPSLCECRVGSGKLFILASGWGPRDSQLARSSKFVPLMSGLLAEGERELPLRNEYVVGEVVRHPGLRTAGIRRVVHKPVDEEVAASERASLDAPGVYSMPTPDGPHRFAVNLAADESRTAPLAVEELERRGVRLGGHPPSAQRRENWRQLRRGELEGRQKLWKWLLLGALSLVLAETFVSGMIQRSKR